LRFTFEGRSYEGYAGDTLASALMANGVRVLGRSFKYHRPRGLLAAGAEEPNALVQLGQGARTAVNLRATEIVLENDLVAAPVNCWPSVGFDLGAVNNVFNRFLAAGFYYKTFMWPDWRLFEGPIRRMAGLGAPSPLPDPDDYDAIHAHCDVLVVGAGPTGLAAARAASASGARVILVEQDFAPGGSLLWDPAVIDGVSSAVWVAHTVAAIAAASEARILLNTTALGYFDQNALTLVERKPGDAARERIWKVRAGQVILATGALERPLVFPGNDRPGVMLAGAIRHYIHRFAVKPGSRAVIVTNNDDAYETVVSLKAAGIEIVALADTRTAPPPALVRALTENNVPLIAGADVVGTSGGKTLTGVTISGADSRVKLACDLLAMSGGFNPAAHLFTQSGGQLTYDEQKACLVPAHSAQAEVSVGAAAGDFALDSALTAAHKAGLAAAMKDGFSTGIVAPSAAGRPAPSVAAHWAPAYPGKAFVDFQNDVTSDDIALSARENYISVEHLKRYTTLGMAADQGKTSNVNALAIMAGLTGRGIAETGTTRNRFPYTPVSLGAFKGLAEREAFRAMRRMPLHDWHAAHGAVFEDYGGWERPAYYVRSGESAHDAEQREARAVREAVGMFDGTPLGKIEVRGPDAATFLDRVYANTMSTLEPGRLRYGLMLNELGVVIDDGIVARIAADHFLVGTTGAGAARIAAWLEEWLQCEWPDFDVVTVPVTTAWAVLTLSGPRARDVLAAAGTDIDLSPVAFAHMTFRDGQVGGMAARIFRVSFTGEASYEINVPAGKALRLWDRLMTAGAAYGIVPIGIDAWMLLRTEKGYLHVGADTDGTTVPDDIGWGHVIRKKCDFVGKRSLSLPNNTRADRPQLVGIEALDGTVPPLGAHLVTEGVSGSQGYITSSGFSPALGRGVALAMVHGGRARMGETLRLAERTAAKMRITKPGAYDTDGGRLHA
jgi:sarcosine oxidase subunit alpha